MSYTAQEVKGHTSLEGQGQPQIFNICPNSYGCEKLDMMKSDEPQMLQTDQEVKGQMSTSCETENLHWSLRNVTLSGLSKKSTDITKENA